MADHPDQESQTPGAAGDASLELARLKKAVVTVIARGGFSALSVDAICLEAGSPVSAFHQHWPALWDALADALDERARLPSLPDKGDVVADLTAYMAAYLDTCSDPEFSGFMFYVMAQFKTDAALAERLKPGFEDRRLANRALIERGIARGEVSVDLDPDGVLDQTLMTVLAWMGTGSRPSQAELTKTARRLLELAT